MNDKKLYNLIYIAILAAFLALQAFSLNIQADLWWDSSVYVGMGKYIYSFGESGLWEPSRPLAWPLIIGFYWKIGIDYLFFSKLTIILFGVASAALTYKIALKLFNVTVATYTLLFLCLSSTFFIYNGVLQTEIPSMFFFLLGFYFFLQKKTKLSGFIFGTAVMTRFFQVFLIIPIILSLIYLLVKGKERIKNIALFMLCFFIPIIPYLIFNMYLYNDMLYPLSLQAFMTKNTGWIFNHSASFYFTSLFKENFLIVFSLFGIIALFRKNFEKKIFLFIFLFAFGLYTLAKHKEMRLLISILPFLYAITSLGFLSFFKKFGLYKKPLIIIMMAVFLIQASTQLRFNKYDDHFDPFYAYMGSASIKDGIWISNPSFIALTNKKADELIYYPIYNSTKAKYLQSKINDASLVMFNTCDVMPCHPDDKRCILETEKLIGAFSKNLRLMHNSTYNGCNYLIFQEA